MKIFARNRYQFWPWVLAGIILSANFSPNIRVQAADSLAARTEYIPDGFPLECRTNDLVMLDFAADQARQRLTVPKDFSVTRAGGSVAVSGLMRRGSQNFTISSGGNPWDLSDYLYLAADLCNGSGEAVTIICRAEDPQYAGWHHYAESVARVGAGESATVLVLLKRKNGPPESLRSLFPGMSALPDGYMPHWSGLDPVHVSKVVLSVESSGTDLRLKLRRLRACGICDAKPLTAPGFFPFIDSYGQFRYADWPTKIHSPQDLAAQGVAEAAALQLHPRPESWDKYGGFEGGPRLAASGNFRVEKYAGKWWLVDPEGRLFWSHGVTCVGFSAVTPVAGRRHFFAAIPAANQEGHAGVNWYLANLKLKYGADAEAAAITIAHERLSSWGLNTMACWSDEAVTRRDKTPYTKILFIGAPRLAPGLRLPDPFDEAFTRSARTAFEAERDATGTDPWCIGYFIGNELEWRAGPDLVNEVLTAPAKQPGKQKLVELLQQRHPDIADLNQAWHTTYVSWLALLTATNRVNATLALNDFTAFNEELAQRYYQTCETELKRATPGKLNLGSRFNTVNPIAVRAAARYCDVVSFNKYETSIRNLKLPDGLDRPIIIGEFHFPAWDRSYAAGADCGRLAEVQRADSYWYYLAGALDNPLVVGTHWFQYLDQPLTGRPDGENYPIGFVDVTDTPYDELVKVTRELGDHLYARRLQITAAAAGSTGRQDSKPAMPHGS